MAETKSQYKFSWTTTELVYIVVFDTVFGVLGTAFAVGLSVALGIPVIGGYLAAPFGGLFGLGGMVPQYIIRKPLTMVLAIWIKNTVEFLTGDPAGITVFVYAIGWTWGGILMFDLIGRQRLWSTWYMMVAGAVCTFAQMFPLAYYMMGTLFLPWWLWLPQAAIGWIVGSVSLGLLTVLISKGLLRAGVLSGMAIAEAERLKQEKAK